MLRSCMMSCSIAWRCYFPSLLPCGSPEQASSEDWYPASPYTQARRSLLREPGIRTQNKNNIMKEIQAIGRRIQAYNNSLDRSLVRKVLILYEEKVFFIGDTCLRFDKF